MDESISSDSTRLPQQGDPLQSSDSVGLKDVSAWVEEYQARRDRSSQNSQTSRPRPTYYAPTTMTETFDNVDSVNRANSVYSTDSMDIDDSVYSTDSMDIDDSVHSGDSGDSVNSTPMLTPESALNNLLDTDDDAPPEEAPEINQPRHNRKRWLSRSYQILGLDNESSGYLPSRRGYQRPARISPRPGAHLRGTKQPQPELCIEPIGRQLGPLPQPFQSLYSDVHVPNLSSESGKEDLGQITEEELSDRLTPLNLEAEHNTPTPGGTEPNEERSESTGEANADPEETSSHSTGSSSRESAEDSSSAGDSTCLETTRCMSPGEIASMRRDVLIDRLMIWLQNLLAQRFAEWTCVEADQSSGRHRHSVPPSDTLHRTEYRGQRAGKRRQDTEDKDDDHRDDENGDDTTQKKPRKDGADTSLLLACPFFKHNREGCRGTKWAWCWHGWPTVHRVKEHLYRRHLLPRYQCNRCFQDLKSLAGLTDHQRLPTPCQLEDPEPREGINEDQERSLRLKRRNKEKLSEEDKWVEVYKLLFPGDELIPSPYQGFFGTDPASDQQDEGSLLRRFETFSQNEFPRRMRPHIEDLVDRAVEQTLTPETLTRVFGTVLQGIFSAFREMNGLRENNLRTDAPLEASEEVDIQPDAPRQIRELPENEVPAMYRQDDIYASDMQLLGNFLEQAPGQEVEFDFVKFLKSFEEEDKSS